MKLKRILALAAVIILAGMYGAVLVFSLSDSPAAPDLFKAAIFCTVVIPVLLYGFLLIARNVKKGREERRKAEEEKTNKKGE